MSNTASLRPWQRILDGPGLLGADGSAAPTIFAEMTQLANAHGAINLGQGFPDEDGPKEMLEAAQQAISDGVNQYPPARGFEQLSTAIARHQHDWYGIDYDPETEVLVTAGATEGLAATILALVDTGDEVVVFQPYYDEYAALVEFVGGKLVPVDLLAPDFNPDLDELRQRVNSRTRIILVNDPHNPTGAVFSAETRRVIAELAAQYDALIVTDEVYEHAVYDGATHVPIALEPAATGRTIQISSAAKTFSVTGWKIGWVTAPAKYITQIVSVKQYLTFAGGAPFQPAIATALDLPKSYFTEFSADLQHKRDVLVSALTKAGLKPFHAAGSYFVVADGSSLGFTDAVDACRQLPKLAGVGAVPITAFVGEADKHKYRHLIRFAFCKRLDVLSDAATRLGEFAAQQ